MSKLEKTFFTLLFLSMSISIYVLYILNVSKDREMKEIKNDLREAAQLLKQCEIATENE